MNTIEPAERYELSLQRLQIHMKTLGIALDDPILLPKNTATMNEIYSSEIAKLENELCKMEKPEDRLAEIKLIHARLDAFKMIPLCLASIRRIVAAGDVSPEAKYSHLSDPVSASVEMA